MAKACICDFWCRESKHELVCIHTHTHTHTHTHSLGAHSCQRWKISSKGVNLTFAFYNWEKSSPREARDLCSWCCEMGQSWMITVGYLGMGQWWVSKWVTASGEVKALMCSTCLCPWCKHFHDGDFILKWYHWMCSLEGMYDCLSQTNFCGSSVPLWRGMELLIDICGLPVQHLFPFLVSVP